MAGVEDVVVAGVFEDSVDFVLSAGFDASELFESLLSAGFVRESVR